MSTRSIIARPYGDGFEGRYVHSDGYPTGVGKHLHEQFHTAFGGDLDAMIARLIDGERIGWSALGGYDLSKPSGWLDFYGAGEGTPADKYRRDPNERFSSIDWERVYAENGPQSYTERGEKLDADEDPEVGRMLRWTGNDEDLWGTEWAYVLTPDGLMVHKVGRDGPTPVALVRWDDPAPDWESVECGADLNRCGHVEGFHDRKAS